MLLEILFDRAQSRFVFEHASAKDEFVDGVAPRSFVEESQRTSNFIRDKLADLGDNFVDFLRNNRIAHRFARLECLGFFARDAQFFLNFFGNLVSANRNIARELRHTARHHRNRRHRGADVDDANALRRLRFAINRLYHIM